MECDLKTTFFGDTSLEQQSNEFLGAPNPKRRKYKEAEEAILQDILDEKGIQRQDAYARQALSNLMQESNPSVCLCLTGVR